MYITQKKALLERIKQRLLELLLDFKNYSLAEAPSTQDPTLDAFNPPTSLIKHPLLKESFRVEWVRLGEIGKICMCKRILKVQTSKVGDIPFYQIGTFGNKATSYISQEVYEYYKTHYPFPKKGQVLISASGTIGKCVIYNGEPAYFQDSNIVWVDIDESIILNKFLYYLYAATDWERYSVGGGTIQRLYNDNLRALPLPLPPLLIQEKIIHLISTLDNLIVLYAKQQTLLERITHHFRDQFAGELNDRERF
ncbi:restriction endonuclease subunit S [Helicobacter suis]|uniref:restriction endonuclease subunit S n=1 Tax=Helicobacter suis TaxID=104628 RepID=UPI00196876E5|nr:restriction endonuclease subunit S [Helicobacter suis]